MSGFHSILLRTWVTLLGENEEQIDHISKGHWVTLLSFRVLWSPVPDIWQPPGIMVSFFIVLLLETMWSPFKKCLCSGMNLWGCKPLFIYSTRGLFFLSIVTFRYLVEMAADLPTYGHFLSQIDTTPSRAPWQVLGIPEPASHLSPRSLFKITYIRFSPFCWNFEGWRCEVWLPLRFLRECECWFHKPSMKGYMNRLYRCHV